MCHGANLCRQWLTSPWQHPSVDIWLCRDVSHPPIHYITNTIAHGVTIFCMWSFSAAQVSFVSWQELIKDNLTFDDRSAFSSNLITFLFFWKGESLNWSKFVQVDLASINIEIHLEMHVRIQLWVICKSNSKVAHWEWPNKTLIKGWQHLHKVHRIDKQTMQLGNR